MKKNAAEGRQIMEWDTERRNYVR